MFHVTRLDPLHDAVREYRQAAQRIRSGDHAAAQDLVAAGARIRDDFGEAQLHRLLAAAARGIRPDQDLEDRVSAEFARVDTARRHARGDHLMGIGLTPPDPRRFVVPTW